VSVPGRLLWQPGCPQRTWARILVQALPTRRRPCTSRGCGSGRLSAPCTAGPGMGTPHTQTKSAHVSERQISCWQSGEGKGVSTGLVTKMQNIELLSAILAPFQVAQSRRGGIMCALASLANIFQHMIVVDGCIQGCFSEASNSYESVVNIPHDMERRPSVQTIRAQCPMPAHVCFPSLLCCNMIHAMDRAPSQQNASL